MDMDDDLDFCSIFTNNSNNTTISDGIARSNGNIDEAEAKIRLLNELVTAASVQMCGYLQFLLAMRCIVSTFRKRKRNMNVKRKRRCNVHRDRAADISFINSWSDDMFRRQFRVTRADFALLEGTILEHMQINGYDYAKHASYAARSSGSPISLELRLYITLRILSGASYLDMIWYGVEIRSVPGLFWRTVCDMDAALDNINFPTDEPGIRQVVENWAIKRKDRHGFATNMGTALAVDGFVIETVKPDPKDLNGQEVSCYRNRKGVWGLISQVACDANAKIRFVQTDWPGATNDLTCFRETALFMLLKSDNFPEWLHIVADEAYSPLSAECGWRILTPYSQHQLNSAKQKDWQNLQDWKDRMAIDANVTLAKPVDEYWKMRAFNHELSSERITIE